MRYPNPTPAPPGRAHDQARHAWRRPQRQGHARTSFPNPEAKTASADGTAPARVWESRTPPPAHHKRGGARHGPPLSHTCKHRASAHDHAHTGHSEPHTRTATANTRHTDTPATVNPTARGPHKATVPHGHTRTGPHTPKLVKPHRIFAHLFWARAFVWADGVERGWACVGLLTASRALRPCLRLSRLCFSLWNGRSRGAVLGLWSEFWRGCDAAGAGAVPCSKPNGPLSSATREVGMASPVLGSVRRTGRRPSTTPRAEASLTPAIASFRSFSVGRFPALVL